VSRSNHRWSDAAYTQLATILRERAGLIFQDLRRPAVEHAARQVMQRVSIQSPELFVPLVAQDGAVFDDLMGEVTVGETYFFREPGHFALLRERIIPEFKQQIGEVRRFRAWSAGASTGEEPYSIAIALREKGVAGDVLGTDISRARLADARHATYRRWSFRGVPEATIAKYFKQRGDLFTLAPALRHDVEFRYLNLASDCYPAMSSGVWGMDVIFCRNVLIYFDRETIAHVARSLIDSLADDGWILLGATDPPLNEFVRCDVVQTPSGLVYRRPRPGSKARTAAPAASVAAPRAKPAPPAPHRAEMPPARAEQPIVSPQQPSRAAEGDVADSGMAPALVEAAPVESVVAAERVRALANAGRLVEAGRECAAALDAHRECAELHYLHAVLVAQAHQFAESARAARRALYLDRSMIVAHAALGSALAKGGDEAGARRAFANATRLLEAMPPDAIVPYSGGEPAARLLEMTRMQASLTEVAS